MSILQSHMNELYECTDLDSCRKLALQIVTNSRINSKDKHIMAVKIGQQTSLIALQTYLTNSFFKYVGMGV